MKIRIKSSLKIPSAEAIKIMRRHTSFGIEEIKKRFSNNDVIYEFETLEDEKEHTVFQLIRELENAGVSLKYYEYFDEEEEEITEQLVKNLFQRSREISEQIDRENDENSLTT